MPFMLLIEMLPKCRKLEPEGAASLRSLKERVTNTDV
jgi:hypothetical protein